MPSDISTHVLHTEPKRGFQSISSNSTLDLNNLSSLNVFGDDIFLTAANRSDYAPWLYGETPDDSGALHNSTACAVVMVERTPQDLDVFYFYFYSFNEGGDITQVVPPLEKILPDAKPGDHYGNHVGDWEHNMIRFRDSKPTGIYFSQHGSGQSCAWDDGTCLSKQGDRPVVFSARGSHANYPSEGHHIHDDALIDFADKGRIWDPIKLAYYYHYNPDTEIFTPADPGTDPVDWLEFNGAWGDKQYLDSDPRQATVPYFGSKKSVDGPNGPKFKQLVRNGLKPDHVAKDPMIKILVRWYLSWYGCCLKGWNPWVVIVFLSLLLVVFIALVVFAVKKLKRPIKNWIATRLRRKQMPDQADVQLRLLDPEQTDDI